MKRSAGSIVGLLVSALWACGQVDLGVSSFSFLPSTIDTLVNPETVTFTLVNYGPDDCPSVYVEYILSRNATLGAPEDRLLAAQTYDIQLPAFEYGDFGLPPLGRADLTIPSDATGHYYVFIRVTPLPGPDADASDNTAQAGNVLTVNPLTASTYAVFANSAIVSSNMAVTPGSAFQYNSAYGNNWRILVRGGGFTSTFTAPSAGEYQVKVRHLTSSSASCPGNGYSPVTVLLNGAPIVTDFDVGLAHGGSHGFETDTWTVAGQPGENTLEWVAGDFCTHYWIQRIEITRLLKFTDLSPLPGGGMQLTLVGEPGRTNAIQVSTDLANWAPLTNLFNATGTLLWADTPPPGSNQRFYRAVEK